MPNTNLLVNDRFKAFLVTEVGSPNSPGDNSDQPEMFLEAVTITSALAGTAVPILSDARVGPNRKVYVESVTWRVNGVTAWGTTATLKVQDTNGTPVDFATVAIAGLTSQARLYLGTANVTDEDARSLGTGGTLAKGLQVKGNANGTGSDVVVIVRGWIK